MDSSSVLLLLLVYLWKLLPTYTCLVASLKTLNGYHTNVTHTYFLASYQSFSNPHIGSLFYSIARPPVALPYICNLHHHYSSRIPPPAQSYYTVLSTTVYSTSSCLQKFAMQATAVPLYLGYLGVSHTQPMAAQVPGTSPPTFCMQPTAAKHPL